ncbi:translation initiation factor [Candidatus Laterigemmans baculatus]|uniref:translation initiation factor n=1 Tax=Candidatus Laterigemmans baculatus TaxID=2770505 RepID=UPI0013DCBFBC|nr:translation initiation factor [Candidatus Laterigemmans baculatus]
MTRLFAGTQWDRPPTCEVCGELEEQCRCPPPPRQYADPATQTARIAVEKRKGGKRVTVVRGLAAAENNLPELLTQLKNHCGAGGTVKEDELEIQGDQAAAVRRILEQLGYKVKG